MGLNSLKDVLKHQLEDLYSAETQLVTALPKMEQAATNDELKTAFKEHLEETALAHGNCGTVRGQIELLANQPVAAERALRASYEALAAMGDRAHGATRAAELAEAVYLNGRHEDAWRLTETAEETAPVCGSEEEELTLVLADVGDEVTLEYAQHCGGDDQLLILDVATTGLGLDPMPEVAWTVEIEGMEPFSGTSPLYDFSDTNEPSGLRS